MHKSKYRYFYHIFVSPGDALGSITLNVVWMEREFDAYKLSGSMCPPNYKRFWDRARYWSKIVVFYTPLAFDTLVRGVSVGISPTRFVSERLEWCGYPMVKKIWRYVYSFWHDPRTWKTNRQTDTALRHIQRLCIASRGKNRDFWTYALT